VNQENATGFESNNYILATALNRSDAFTREFGRHLSRLVGTDEPRVEDLDRLELPAGEHGREACANGLDLGQLGHAASVVMALSAGPTGASLQAMAILGGLIGLIVGFVVGILLVEVLFANNASWPDVVPFGLAVLGWLVGSSFVRRRRGHAPDAPVAGPH
jgi:hypothetical protein